MRIAPIVFGILIGFATVPAFAQGTANFSLLGTIEKADAAAIAVKSDASGAIEDFKRAANMLVLRNQPATLADIAPGDYVATAARRGADGKLHSTELRIFPPAMRGVGEGQRPMNDPTNQTMTNATVKEVMTDATVSQVGGGKTPMIKLTFHGAGAPGANPGGRGSEAPGPGGEAMSPAERRRTRLAEVRAASQAEAAANSS